MSIPVMMEKPNLGPEVVNLGSLWSQRNDDGGLVNLCVD